MPTIEQGNSVARRTDFTPNGQRMNIHAPVPPADNLTVRVGCRLIYDAASPVPVMFNLKPRMDAGRILQAELLRFGNDLPATAFTDTHDNTHFRLVLPAGRTEVVHDAIVSVPDRPDNAEFTSANPLSPHELPAEVLRYTLPSRYCDSDKLTNFAWEKFGLIPHGLPRAQAISDWLHNQIEYRFASGRPDLSAWDVIQRGYGVCRDFAHTFIALCRTFNLPARYVTGHLPDIGYTDPGSPMDFHAYAEVFIDGHWFTFDPRYNVPRIGRVTVARGLDAVNGAFATIYGAATLSYFEVWAYQVAAGAVSIGDPIDLSKRLDGTPEIRR
ncbi:MAG TPA: transglutaminase family protein [Rariglobus sp.]|jgi:transglutaminase-like putative cysteine protease|nr:transglutaminase family protein [Rariglobus sp.]